MKAIERMFFSQDWITLLLLLAMGLVYLMKLYSPKLLVGYFSAFFTQGFIEKRLEDNPTTFSSFYVMLFIFKSLIFSLFFSLFFFKKEMLTFGSFKYVFLFFIIYLIVRYLLDIFLEKLLQTENLTNYLRFSKAAYLYTISLWLFPILILHQYAFNSRILSLVFIVGLFLLRFLLLIRNNKKLIYNGFLYFILYFCTLEIAPLLILYKIITV